MGQPAGELFSWICAKSFTLASYGTEWKRWSRERSSSYLTSDFKCLIGYNCYLEMTGASEREIYKGAIVNEKCRLRLFHNWRRRGWMKHISDKYDVILYVNSLDCKMNIDTSIQERERERTDSRSCPMLMMWGNEVGGDILGVKREMPPTENSLITSSSTNEFVGKSCTINNNHFDASIQHYQLRKQILSYKYKNYFRSTQMIWANLVSAKDTWFRYPTYIHYLHNRKVWNSGFWTNIPHQKMIPLNVQLWTKGPSHAFEDQTWTHHQAWKFR